MRDCRAEEVSATQASTTSPSTGARYVSYSIETLCPHCNRGMPICSPVQRERCPTCEADVELDEAFWLEVLSSPHRDADEHLLEHGGRGGWALVDGRLRGSWQVLDGPPDDGTPPLSSPAWLSSIYPPAAQIFVPQNPTRPASGPVSTSCPACGATLTVTTQDPRSVGCSSCHARVYLPDRLWLGLHPPRLRTSWSVRFDGPPRELPPPARARQRTITGTKYAVPEHYEPRSTFVFYETSTICQSCNRNLPINGPTREARCPDCLSTVTLDVDFWREVLTAPQASAEEHLREYDGRGGWALTDGIRGIWQLCLPHCSACGTTLPSSIANATGNATCPGCGEKIAVASPPPWLKELSPSVDRLIQAEVDGGNTATTAAVAQVEAGASAVMLSCPSCGAALKVDGSSERLVLCEYCQRRVFLPDELWRTIHPPRRVKRWLVHVTEPQRAPTPGPPPHAVDPHRGIAESVAWIRYELRSSCPHCNAGVPINAIRRTERCPRCLTELDTSGFWEDVLREPYENMAEHLREYDGRGGWRYLDGSLQGSWQVMAPRCPACDREIGLDELAAQPPARWTCSSCGERREILAPPSWSTELSPELQRWFATHEHDEDGDDSAPVVCTCPNCGAALSIDSAARRTMCCKYCDGQVIIPDALWLELHPPRFLSPWYACFTRPPGLRLSGADEPSLPSGSSAQPRHGRGELPPSPMAPSPPPPVSTSTGSPMAMPAPVPGPLSPAPTFPAEPRGIGGVEPAKRGSARLVVALVVLVLVSIAVLLGAILLLR